MFWTKTKTAPLEAGATGDPGNTAPNDEAHHSRVLPPTSGAEAIIRRSTAWSAGFGLIPLPFVDFVAITGLSLNMLHNLAKYYGIEFRTELGKAAITSLLGGATTPMLALAASSAAKSIPVVGLSIAVLSGPIIAGSLTYAIGRVFATHFGAGGTLFDFDPEKFRTYFQEQVEAGKEYVRQRSNGGSADSMDPRSTS